MGNKDEWKEEWKCTDCWNRCVLKTEMKTKKPTCPCGTTEKFQDTGFI